LVKDGIEPRVPLPGAKIEEGMLHMYSAFAGLQLEYQVAGQAWQAFEGPVPVTSQDAISVRATIPLTQVSSRVQILSKGGL
jgi:hexosaminidase